MKKLLLITSFLFLSTLMNASVTIQGIYFNDYEEKASLYLCNYYPLQAFIDLGLSNIQSERIIDNRVNIYTSLADMQNINSLDSYDLDRIKKQSHLIDWNVYTDDFGMTLHQTNFLYGLTGALIGFTFLFGFIQIIISEEFK